MFTEAFPIITVPDLTAAVAFYRDRLAFREAYRYPPEGEPEFVTLKLGTSEIGLGTGETSYTLCVYADDCDAAVAELGAPIVAAPADMPWGERAARVEDPAGNEILIVAKL
jgi:lactoylglutathione lyase